MHQYCRQWGILVGGVLQGVSVGASKCSYMVGIIVYGQVRAPECCLMR